MTADQKIRAATVALEEAARAMRRLEAQTRVVNAGLSIHVGHLRNQIERAQLGLGDLRGELLDCFEERVAA